MEENNNTKTGSQIRKRHVHDTHISVCHEEDMDTKLQLFREQYDTIAHMRYTDGGIASNAPVDTLGCAQVPDRHDKSSKSYRFQTLVSLMLSSQTKDEVTHAAVRRLVDAGLSPQNLMNAGHQLGKSENVEQLIYPAGFYRRKAQYLKRVAGILLEKYDGDVPTTIEELCALPGVGPKMAHLFVNTTTGVPQGIGVDVHVHRISNRIEWVNNTKSPEHTRKELESFVPRENWHGINELLVGFGQTVCKAIAPQCEVCELNTTCSFFAKHGDRKGKRVKRMMDERPLEDEQDEKDTSGIPTLTGGSILVTSEETNIEDLLTEDTQPADNLKIVRPKLPRRAKRSAKYPE